MKFIVIFFISLSSLANAEERPYFDVKDLTSSYVGWGVDPNNSASINLLDAWKKYKKKKDIVVAVVDTGIDPTHPFLENNIFVEKDKPSPSNFGMDFSEDTKTSKPIDTFGHGTHVSGIIKSVYPEVKILALKYWIDEKSPNSLSASTNALRYAVDNNADIINYSGGGIASSSEELAILKEAEKKGILVVVAAGNNSSDIDFKSNTYYPASYGLKNVISVTAHNKELRILNSSNYGKNTVDIAAPGYLIKSSIQNGKYGVLTGTSQATAFVTGVAALIKSEYPGLSTEKIKEIIKASAKKELTMEGKCATGGRLDAAAALALAAQY